MKTKFKKKYGLIDYYYALVLSHRALLRIFLNHINPKIDAKFIERLMLAVTEVNGCEVCSYAHTKIALKGGFSQEEINCFLSASEAYILPEEAKGILFAQHYADSNARPDREVYSELVNEYGLAKSKIIISAIQVIMMGNVVGIPLSAFLSRVKGSPYKNSSLFYEIGIQLIGLIFLPLSFIHALVRWISFRRNIRFSR